ncbi:MAG TPA: alkene reductase [Herbaspirillum sp.]|uniref:alkene reductase n=1 Tax=unclassified Herbaspirillum TaxID=2624150 RepID=UPI001F52A5DA|nr:MULTISPECIES: alkene reductase [unclassified Herbaspirillum]MCI1013240.1 alkene reductase [Herbaspirillum sp. C7C2]HZG20713.1 alkene reductase [Herbaspirillum sp.]
MNALLQPLSIGPLHLSNRIAMAPVTRARAGANGVPTALNAHYYRQRASAGLIIAEATNVSPMSAAFEDAPGIHHPDQVAGWKDVASAVHEAGGKLFVQLWHGGRISTYALLDGAAPLSPSGMNDDLGLLQVYGALRNGYYTRIAASPSRAMSVEEIHATVQEFRTAARHAVLAGIDGVEIHAANGYLPQQFLSSHVNRRQDQFGGSIENRARFLRLIIEAVLQEMPAAQVGVRLSPFALYNNAIDAGADGPGDSDTRATYAYVAQMLNGYGIGYLHAADTNAWSGNKDMPRILEILRPHFKGVLIANGGLSFEQAEQLVVAGQADMVAFGRQYIANPDLAARIAQGGPFNEPDPFTFYGGDDIGYTDYPALS